MTTANEMRSKPVRQDIAVWPDGTWAELGHVWNGEYGYMSDDYEVVKFDDEARLKALGIEQ